MGINKSAKNINIYVKGNYTIKAGTITEIADKITISATNGNLTLTSNKKIIIEGKEGIVFGEPTFITPKNEINESEYKLESTYIHDHIKSVAAEMVTKFDSDNTGIVYTLYKEIANGKVVNPPIIVSKRPYTNEIAFYDEQNEKIVVWEHYLKNIEKDNDKKIKLAAGLTTSYGKYIDTILKDHINPKENLETYDYDLFRFDALGDTVVTIAKLESPDYNGNLEISFPKEENEKQETEYYRQNKNARGGPNPGDFDNYEDSGTSASAGPGDPPLNIGLKFSFSLGGGFSASLYAGISKEIARAGDLHVMSSLNGALTYYGNGTPGTSPLSRHLLNATLTPAVTLGYKTGNALNMNLFTSFAGSGVNNPYEYAFTLGSTGVLSSGKVTSTVDKDGKIMVDKDGKRIKDQYNSQDNPNRNQIIGGTSIKIGNFMVSSYNDIYKLPLFLGMDSDQYWSAGVNMQARLNDKVSMAYAFDLYYGKSNNKGPYNRDKIINGQNYDYQRLYDVLLNRGQETFSFTDANGNLHISTRFGYGTFWPANKMHNNIKFPTVPKEPKMPTEPLDQSNEKLNKKYKEDLIEYEKELKLYKRNKEDYEASIRLKPNPTFHHLFVVYGEDSKQPKLERINTYMDAKPPTKTLLQEFYELDKINLDKINKDKLKNEKKDEK
ncbi:MAG TPA: hypothetical protein VF677_12425 [Flavobacterium sp.]|jgi:hypothetical protein